MEILAYDFMVRAFISGIAISIAAPLIGTYLVVRRYSLMADTLAHVSLLGITIGFFVAFYPLLFAVLTSIIAAVIIEKLRRNGRMPGDAILAMFISGSLATTVILFSLMGGVGMNLFAFLFGSITTVSVIDLCLIVPLSLLVIIFVFIFQKELFITSLDEELAKADKIKSETINYLLVILTAIIVSLSIKIIGALLVGALMVIPVMTAINFKRGFYTTKNIAVIISFLSVITGLVSSYYLGLPSGGTIVATLLFFFLFSFLKE